MKKENANNLLPLHSVGMFLNPDDGMTYPMLDDGINADLDAWCPVGDLEDGWMNDLCKHDKESVEKVINKLKDNKIDWIEELQHPWINEGIANVQKKFGMDHGTCSIALDLEFMEVFRNLAKCTYKQLKENGHL